LTYVLLAQRRSVLMSWGSAATVWLALASLARLVHWSLAAGLFANVIAFAICIAAQARYRHARMPPIARRWYDVPLRASLVAMLVATVVTLSGWAGPRIMMLILHPRIGGPATAAVIANSAWGLMGLGIAIAVLHVAALWLGSAAGLSLALTVCVVWNFSLWWISRMRAKPATQRLT
jgi:hypothetical protein